MHNYHACLPVTPLCDHGCWPPVLTMRLIVYYSLSCHKHPLPDTSNSTHNSMYPRRAIYLAELGLYMLIPRNFQGDMFDFVDRNELNKMGGLLVGGCGSGKTEAMIAACILHAAGLTLWVTKKSLLGQTRDRFNKYLAHQSQQHRVVLLGDCDPSLAGSNFPTDSIVVVSFTQLPKFKDCLKSMSFGRIIVGELSDVVSHPQLSLNKLLICCARFKTSTAEV